ncbi:MAG TPA: SDR family NAD(P)-dependent oxidoreductase [Thermoplasmata archaeon]|nr:SDR family NAD(P)-dependent oxidoreductase [Thermoplasmata archaeon]
MAPTPTTSLAGKIALVTGGAAGIGHSTAEELRRVGSKVVIADIDAESGKEVARRIDGTFVEADMTTENGR